MAWSVSDLGQVTQLLIDQLTAAVKASPQYTQQNFNFEVTGLMPEETRKDGNNTLSLYLLQVGRDPYWRNAPVTGNRAQLNTAQPLSLTLSYLLTSHCHKNWQMEQILMSVAMSWFHANPIFVSTNPALEVTITIEADSIEEMSRLWQAISCPIRLSALFRVAVVFLEPAGPPQMDSRTPVEVGLSVGTDLNLPSPSPESEPQLFEAAVERFLRVAPNATDPSQVTLMPGQQGVVAGDILRVRGSGLDQSDGAAVYLSTSGGSEQWRIDASWRQTGTSASGTAGDADELAVWLKGSYGATPAPGATLTAVPMPGIYNIQVGDNAATKFSNSIPVSIAPLVVVPDGTDPAGTELAASGTVYNLTANGLVDGQSQVWIDQTQLTAGASTSPGVATVDASTGAIAFELPTTGLTTGSYLPVRVLVNNVEAPPAWWVLVA
jgi:hypothetical protein